MLYVRGNPADFDGWAQMGCRGWTYDDVLPHFRQSEDYATGRPGGARQGRRAQGRGLPHHPAADPPLRRGGAAGRPRLPPRPQRRRAGRRRLFADDPRRPLPRAPPRGPSCEAARGRANLRIETNAPATRLMFEGKRCVGAALPPRWRGARGARAAGGDPVRRRGQLAASAAGLGHRPGGASASNRRRGGARHAAGRRQPAGPLRRAGVSTG